MCGSVGLGSREDGHPRSWSGGRDGRVRVEKVEEREGEGRGGGRAKEKSEVGKTGVVIVTPFVTRRTEGWGWDGMGRDGR